MYKYIYTEYTEKLGFPNFEIQIKFLNSKPVWGLRVWGLGFRGRHWFRFWVVLAEFQIQKARCNTFFWIPHSNLGDNLKSKA